MKRMASHGNRAFQTRGIPGTSPCTRLPGRGQYDMTHSCQGKIPPPEAGGETRLMPARGKCSRQRAERAWKSVDDGSRFDIKITI